jgi:hypothetical protein
MIDANLLRLIIHNSSYLNHVASYSTMVVLEMETLALSFQNIQKYFTKEAKDQ